MTSRYLIQCAIFVILLGLGEQASANLLLSVRGLGGSSFPDLNPGQEILLTISLQAQSPFILFNGGDFLIRSGSDATFWTATYDLPGAGGWTSLPPEGGTSRFFTGGPAGTHIFFNAGDTLQLGRIVMRIGSSACGTVAFDQVLMLDSAFLPIPTETSGLSYGPLGCPEPSSAILFGFAASGLVFQRRKR